MKSTYSKGRMWLASRGCQGWLLLVVQLAVMAIAGVARGEGGVPERDPKEWIRKVDQILVDAVDGETRKLIAADWAVMEPAVRKLGEAGDPAGNNTLGVVLGLGAGGKAPDPAAALRYFRRAADAGHAEAMTNIGRIYHHGFGVERSPEQALAWFRKGAERGSVAAMNNLGFCYTEGNGVEVDLREGIRWFEKAVDGGFPRACSNLGQVYYAILPPAERDWVKAVKYFNLGIERGDRTSMRRLGRMYCEGNGVPSDPLKGVELTRRAAEAGDSEAMVEMGSYAGAGFGMPRSEEVATAWYERAIAAGDPDAREILAELRAASDIPEPKALTTEATRLYEEKGLEAALAYLEAKTPPISSGRYNDYFTMIWSEAQIDGGRRHPEWGAAIYEWLYKKRFGFSPIGEQPSQAITLLSNLAEMLHDTGRIAHARYYTDKARLVAENLLGRSLVPGSLPDLGPVTEKFPEIRKRDVPTRVEFPVGKHFDVNDAHMHAVSLSSRSAWMTGDWKSHGEAQAWCFQWGEWNLNTHPDLSERDRRETRMALTMGWVGLAETFQLLGFHDLAAEYAQKVVDYDWQGPAGYWGQSTTAAERIVARTALVTGKPGKELIEQLAKNAKREKDNIYSADEPWLVAEVLKIDAMFQLGSESDGWAALNALLEQRKGKSGTLNQAAAMIAWIRHSLDANRLEGVEEKLKDALRECRKNGFKIHEPELYSLYARYLELSGKSEQAIRMQLEAVRLYEALDLYTWLVLEYRKLAEYYLAVGNGPAANRWFKHAQTLLENGRRYPEWIAARARVPLTAPTATQNPPQATAANSSAPTPAKPSGAKTGATAPATAEEIPAVLLQSALVRSNSLPGVNARAAFTLANPSTRPRRGTLRVAGPGTKLAIVGDRLRYTFQPGAAAVIHEQPITLDSNEWITIDTATTAPVPADGSCAAEIAYFEPAGAGPLARWFVNAADDDRTTSLVDAHLVEENPFYLLPVTHCVQTTGKGRRIVNLRATASAPTRIECYRRSGELIFVDANGNGSLADPGDVLFHDDDHNGFGDVALDPEVSDAEITLYYQPLGAFKKVTVELDTRGTNDPWQPDSEDRIVAGGTALAPAEAPEDHDR